MSMLTRLTWLGQLAYIMLQLSGARNISDGIQASRVSNYFDSNCLCHRRYQTDVSGVPNRRYEWIHEPLHPYFVCNEGAKPPHCKANEKPIRVRGPNRPNVDNGWTVSFLEGIDDVALVCTPKKWFVKTEKGGLQREDQTLHAPVPPHIFVKHCIKLADCPFWEDVGYVWGRGSDTVWQSDKHFRWSILTLLSFD